MTYAADVASILQERCQSCHRPGQVAPFALLSYDDARRHAAMIAEVAAFVSRFAAEHGALGRGQVHLLGTSGTVTTIAGVHLELPRYERRRVDACWMTDDEVTRVIERLLGWSHEDRVANACIGAERADLVLAGCAILDAIRRAFPCERIRVADRGLREGMLVQMMREDGVWEGRARGTLT